MFQTESLEVWRPGFLYVATGFGETGYVGWGFPMRIPQYQGLDNHYIHVYKRIIRVGCFWMTISNIRRWSCEILIVPDLRKPSTNTKDVQRLSCPGHWRNQWWVSRLVFPRFLVKTCLQKGRFKKKGLDGGYTNYDYNDERLLRIFFCFKSIKETSHLPAN